MWYRYIAKTSNGLLYTGITTNINRRLKEHQRDPYNPAEEIIYKESFPDKFEAAKRGKQIKGWTKRKKMALIEGKLDLLKRL